MPRVLGKDTRGGGTSIAAPAACPSLAGEFLAGLALAALQATGVAFRSQRLGIVSQAIISALRCVFATPVDLVRPPGIDISAVSFGLRARISDIGRRRLCRGARFERLMMGYIRRLHGGFRRGKECKALSSARKTLARLMLSDSLPPCGRRLSFSKDSCRTTTKGAGEVSVRLRAKPVPY